MIRFYKKRYVFIGISLAIMLIGIIAGFVNGIDLAIDFKGGAVFRYNFTGEINTEEADRVISEALGRNVSCLVTSDLATQTQRLVINVAGNEGISSQDQEKLDQVLKETFADNELELYNSTVVLPYFGKRFFRECLTAVFISFVLIVLYVWLRFRKIGGLSAGVMALVALIHDVLVVFIAFIVFKIPLDENFIAAALTIIGFSINDTIVIYDRIRENVSIMKKASFEELVDTSITQSITRSVNTNLATFASITIVYIFAQIYDISSIRSFALPMMFGIISGCYSTICLAGPLWVMWKNYQKSHRKVKKA
ncbi:MAG: protein translocase subunit SecF [Clostridiaceae bacterium]|nr:protein translocase subunit SecF [Clostridiaceae bacterium]